jgi:hypothetical protein
MAALEFDAPTNAAELPRLVFEAYGTRAGEYSYPGLDEVTLTAVPLPATAAPFAAALVGLWRRRRSVPRIG